MSDLERLQRDFQRHVLSGAVDIAGDVNATDRVPVETRLGIYSNAYRLRLIDALASNYPRLQQFLGEDAFASLARRYIDRYPSTHVSVRWFGARLSELLQDEPSHPQAPWLAELADLEWSIAEAFDAADTPALSAGDLGALAADAWPTLRLSLHPSVRHLHLQTNAPMLFKALSDDQPAPTPERLEQGHSWLIWRRELAPHYRSLSASESCAVETVLAGCTFEAMCDALCAWHEPGEVPATAAGYLKTWISEGMVVAVTPFPPPSSAA